MTKHRIENSLINFKGQDFIFVTNSLTYVERVFIAETE